MDYRCLIQKISQKNVCLCINKVEGRSERVIFQTQLTAFIPELWYPTTAAWHLKKQYKDIENKTEEIDAYAPKIWINF